MSKDLNLKDIWYIEFASSLNLMITFFLVLSVVLFVSKKNNTKNTTREFVTQFYRQSVNAILCVIKWSGVG
jgi:hypothetical protein